MLFQSLTELCEKLSATTKRNQMTENVADFLKILDNEEVEPAVSMLLGRAFPKWDQRTLDVSWATISNVIERLTKTDWKEFSATFKKTGDVGSATQAVFEVNKVHRQAALFEEPLTISEVRKVLEAIAEATGQGARERKERYIESLFGRANPVEAKYLVKILIGEMRTGFHEGLMELAVSKAFSVPLKTVQKATMYTGDIGEVAIICKKQGAQGVSNLSFTIFRPIKPMLAKMAETLDEPLREYGGKAAFEYKLDGARIQIHKLNSEVRIFSRRLTDVTRSLPEVVRQVRQEIAVDKAILEGEVIALGQDGNPLPFQHLMRRFRRVHDINTMLMEVPVKLFLFDALHVNGENLIDFPYLARRQKLKEISGNIPLTEQIITDDVDQAKQFMRKAVDQGHEGLMAKRLDGPYTPGIRGKHWFKIKEILEPLDLVIVAAEYGYGRRHKWLSDYHLAARDEESGSFYMLGKTFKGLTDEEMEDMTQRLLEIAVRQEGHVVFVKPSIVVEVAYNEIQESQTYECGMALRFARITRIREDKSLDEADTIQRVRQIYEKQFEKKSRLNRQQYREG
ncbi:ATP-dependent DNA ligase [Candidatus Bathyarchaeota archaeon]|nr:ATP-dependent DNA ligase [Candidatus Bathyarchaeota archaeon]